MSKKVISFRMSDRELDTLDEACRRYGISRSQAVLRGVELLLGAHHHNDGQLLSPDTGQSLTQRAPWFKTSEPSKK